MTPADVLERLREALAGRYTIERELGRGGMATVYLAHDLRIHRPVALKVLRPELSVEFVAERFLREIETTANLQHPHILPLFDSGQAAGTVYYVMPFVEGESLRQRLAREKQLPIADSLRITSEVAAALDYSHRHGVIHRDIKPENILLHDGQALVADFGVALAVQGEAAGRLTGTGLTIGTPLYMSPEQAAGERELTPRSDVYALGCVLYEMLAGEPPFTGPTPEAVIARRFSTSPPSLRAVRETIPVWVERAVETALARVPGDRFASAAEFARALAPSGATDVPAGVIGSGRKLPGESGRWRRPVLVGLVSLGALAAVVLAGTFLRRQRVRAGSDSGAPGAGPRSIAVLPFTSPERDSTDTWFGSGMAEELTTAFSRVPGLRVASRGSASRFQDAGATDREIARDLGVQTLLEGTVRRAGERLRVTARLIDPQGGTVLWAEQYERRWAQVFDVQDDITRAILTALTPTFSDTTQLGNAHGAARPAELQAYDLYLKGRYWWGRRGEAGLQTAIRYFHEAIAADSTFGRAWAGISMAEVVLPLFSSVPADSALALAARDAQHALLLDSTLADAHLAWAYALKGQWRWEESEREFQKALALAPGDALVHHWYGVLLHVTGRMDEAQAQLHLAKQLDPLALQILADDFYVLYLARHYDEALADGLRAWAQDTTKADASLQIGMIQLARGRPDSALTAFANAERLGIGFDMPAIESAALARLGRTREADSMYRDVARRYRADPSLGYAVAIAGAATGHLDEALAAVTDAVGRRSLYLTELNLPCDPLFDPLKRDSRFTTLLRGKGMHPCPAGGPR